MALSWKYLGVVAKAAIESPPVGSVISTYVLDVDSDGRPLYYCEPDDDQRGSELWTFDGSAWKKLHQKRLTRLGELEGGGWDPTRKALCVFGFDYDYETDADADAWVTHGFAIGLDGKERALKFTGEHPVTEDDEIEPSTFDVRGAFTFDPSREVWVCFTRFGIWELDAKGAWSKRRDRGTDAWASEWSNESGMAFFDPVGKRTVFWLQEGENYQLQAFGWNGSELTPIPLKAGLPKLTHGFSDLSCQLGGHPTHGVLLQVEGKVFALEGSKWKAVPAAGKGPPRMEFALTAFSPKHGWFIGPAKHYESGNEFQRMFFVLKNGVWSSHGVVSNPSALAASGYGHVRMGLADGAWVATSTTALRTWVRDGTEWNERVDDKAGEQIIGRKWLSLVWDTQRLWAINGKGAIAEYRAGTWKVLSKANALFKDRHDYAAAFDVQGRLVLWGGSAKNRRQNDTLVFENGKWRVVKKASTQPSDFRHGDKDSIYVGFHLVFDTTLGRFVRFGFDDVAVQQEDETWAAAKLKGYSKAISERAWGHVPAHDPETGETLLIDFENARIVRFDLAGCTQLETIDWPAALLPKRQHDKAAHHRISESFAYDPKTKTIFAADLEQSTAVYALELGPVFEKAKALGPRKTLGAASAKKASAPKKRVAYRVKNGIVETATAPRAGFVTAEQLDREVLKVMVGVPAEGIKIGKAISKGAAVPKSRLGGPAPAVVAKQWPKVGKERMGFLFQLETGALLKRHAGVAVFCALDGEATNEEKHNAVVLLKAADLAKTTPVPDGVPMLPARPLTFEPSKVELDEERVVALGQKDALLAQVLEKFGASKDVQEPSAQKRGGVPVFLQGQVPMKGWKLVAQLDFDVLGVSKAWLEAGLAGCVYVFVKDDEKDAFAMWQYT